MKAVLGFGIIMILYKVPSDEEESSLVLYLNISSSAHLHVFTNLHTETSEMGTSASMMFRSV